MYKKVYVRLQDGKQRVYLGDTCNVKVGDIVDVDNHIGMKVLCITTVPDISTCRNLKQLVPIHVKSKNKTSMNSLSKNSYLNSFMSRCIPVEQEGVRMTYDLKLCARDREGNYISRKEDGGLKRWPAEMTFEVPMMSMSKKASDIKVGDIIVNANSFSFVNAVKEDGSLRLTSTTGSNHNQQAIEDAIMGASDYRVVVNYFGDNTGMDINKLLMMQYFNGGSMDFDNTTLMMFMASQQGQTAQQNGNIMQTLMLLQLMLMTGNNPFGNMFGGSTTPAQAPVQSADDEIAELEKKLRIAQLKKEVAEAEGNKEA